MQSQTLLAQLESFQKTSAMMKQGPHLHSSWHFEYILLLGVLFRLPHLAGLSYMIIKPSQMSLLPRLTRAAQLILKYPTALGQRSYENQRQRTIKESAQSSSDQEKNHT